MITIDWDREFIQAEEKLRIELRQQVVDTLSKLAHNYHKFLKHTPLDDRLGVQEIREDRNDADSR